MSDNTDEIWSHLNVSWETESLVFILKCIKHTVYDLLGEAIIISTNNIHNFWYVTLNERCLGGKGQNNFPQLFVSTIFVCSTNSASFVCSTNSTRVLSKSKCREIKVHRCKKTIFGRPITFVILSSYHTWECTRRLLTSYQHGKALGVRRLNNWPIFSSMLRLQTRDRSIVWSF